MREADKLFAEGKDGGGFLLAFEQAAAAVMERLLRKAQAALDRFYCFKYQIERFSEAGVGAEVQPPRCAASGTGQEPASVMGATEKATAGVDKPQEPGSPNLFARLAGRRYRIVYADKEETVPMLAGLQVVEYLLKQPGKAAHVLDINRALCEGKPKAADAGDAIARTEGAKGLDGFTADALQQPDPCSDEDLEKAREAVKSLDDQAVRARDGGEHDKADKLECSAGEGRKWIREQESLAARKRRGLPDQGSEVEKIRSRLTKNFTNACKKLKEFRLPELAAHLEEQIESGTRFTYRPAPGIDWGFDSDGPC
jgi:hypothetical protein